MAGKSLGTLTIDLIAQVGGFVGGMNRAERASEDWRTRVENDMKAAGKAVAGMVGVVAAASVAAAGAGIALLKTTSQQVTESDRLAKALKMSTQDLLSWQYAAEKAGLSGDNIADVFKDINDKIGDAVLNKSGEAAGALDTLGLSAEKLAKLSPDKQLMAISESLSKITTQAGKTNILESLGNDLSKMLPLFDNNNEKLKSFIELSKQFGVAPPQEDIDNLVKVNSFFEDIETSAKGLKLEIASGLAKVDLSPIQKGMDDLKDVFTDPSVLEGLTKLVGGVAELVGWMGKLAANTANFMSNLSEVSDRFKAGGWYQFQQQQKLSSMVDTLLSDITFPKDKVNTGQDLSLPPGKSNSGDKGGKGNSQDKIESAFKAAELSYQRQIALIDKVNGKTKETTELQKIQFDINNGKLKGLNEAQQLSLKSLATEIDRLHVLSEFKDLQVDLFTPEQKLLGITQERLKLLREAKGLGLVNDDDYQKAAKAIAGASVMDAPHFDGIDPMFGGQSGELKKVDDAQKDLEKWYQTQLKMLEENRKNQSDLNEQWDAQELALRKKHQEELDGIEQSRNQLMLSSTIDGLGALVDITKSAMGEQSGLYKAAFVAQKAAAIAQSTIAISQGVAMAAANPFPLNLAAMASVAAATAGIVASIQSVSMVGMAHDGIDAVPATGTWLLQKGERVTTAATSAKLDATLDRVSRDTDGRSYAPVSNIVVNGDPDQSTLRAIEEAVARGERRMYGRLTNDIITPQGQFGQALKAKYRRGSPS